MKVLESKPYPRWALIFAFLVLASGLAFAQETDEESDVEEEEDIQELSPFEVVSGDNDGYRATHTLSGTRIRTELEDVASAIQVVTTDFLRDTGVTDNQGLLQYTTNTEVGGIDGNFGGAGGGVQVNEDFSNPSQTTRVRGLAAADNTRNFFLSDIPWDGYNVDRVDIQRGPNSILFGFGSPAGIINTGLIKPNFDNRYRGEFRFGSYGSYRMSVDFNQVILEDQLSVRAAGVMDKQKFKQDPAYEDDQRLFLSARYEPDFLKSDNMRSSFTAYFEKGDIIANRPRSIVVQDRITPWFRDVTTDPNDPFSYNPLGGVGQGLFTPQQLEDTSGTPGAGQNRRNLANGDLNPFFIPSVGNYAQVFGGPIAFVPDASTGVISESFVSEFDTSKGIGPDGVRDGNFYTGGFARMGSVDTFANFAKDAGLPFAEFGQYKNNSLTDPAIFDFYNYLLDGPNKTERQDFKNYNISWAQTFWQDRLGFELVYDRQEYFQAGTSLITDPRQSIHIDINSTLIDGRDNPNAGRPFVSDSGQFGNNRRDTDRDVLRLTAFAEHDFRWYGENFFTKLLGRQNLTALFSNDKNETTQVGWQQRAMGQAYRDFFEVPDIRDNQNSYNHSIYIGPSLVGRSSAANAGITNVASAFVVPNSAPITFFDSTWNSTVDPAAEWIDPDGNTSTQSENPANYVGWTTREFAIEQVDYRDPTRLATSGQMTKNETDSTALVIQNYFWDGAVVGTFGWRKDDASAWSDQADEEDLTRRAMIEDLMITGDPSNEISVETKSYSAVVHLNRLPLLDALPFGASLYYNQSENFQPAAGRVDLFGRSIAPPSGETEDYAVLLQTRDGRYSLKVTRYETSVVNSSSSRINGDWYLSRLQAWGENWKNKFKFDIQAGQQNNPHGSNTYSPAPGETQEQADAREAAAIAGWEAHVQNLYALSNELAGDPLAFDNANSIDRSIIGENAISSANPPGLAFTEDTQSEGWEIEFTARPMNNWDLTFNATKVEATRTNVGGEALLRYVELVNNDLNNTAAGDLRIWWGSPGSETTLIQWNSNFNANFNLTKLQEGTSAPEIRKWRFNLITNYRFTEGFMNGFNIGGGYRWQDKVEIGYIPSYTDSTQTEVTFDLENPYTGPSESNLDMWLGYGRRLNDKVDWRIQLNVRNIGMGDDLIPINTQPDGTPAVYRIAPTTQWQVTNTFTF